MSTTIFKTRTSTYIENELNNIKLHNPDWYLKLFKERENIDFYDLIESKIYHSEIKKYKKEELDELLIKMNELSRVKNYTHSQILFLGNRYCRNNELPIELYALTALVISSKEAKRTRLEKVLEVFEAIYLNYISLATPILLNARLNLSEKTSISSCFISNVEDNLNSFSENINRTMNVLTYGGGMGLCVNEIRSKGSMLRGLSGKAKGVKKSFLTIISSIARSIDQAGLRPGNVTVAIGIDHIDCLDVINARREYGSDVSSIEDNISNLFPQIILNSVFMERCKEKKEWYLFDPYEAQQKLGINLNRVYGDVYRSQYYFLENLAKNKKIKSVKYDNAMDLMKQIILSYIQTGFPYLYYKDNANKFNILSNDNSLNLCGNLCMESFTPIENTIHVCSLSSVNVFKASTPEKRVYYSKLTCRILNNLISIFNKNSPLIGVMVHNDKTKPIGVGIMGLADYYAERGILYSSLEAKTEASKIMEDIAYGAVLGSVELAKEYPTKIFQDFEKSSWNEGKMFSKDIEWFKENSYDFERWENIKNDISLYKIFNGYLLSIAPNTSTANVLGVTPSWFPRMNTTLQYKSTVGSAFICPPTTEDKWINYEFDQDIDQNHKIDIAVELQKWTDQGVSFEMVFSLKEGAYDKKLPPKIFEWFVNSWEKGLKSIYYGTSKVEIKSTTCSIDNCESCSG